MGGVIMFQKVKVILPEINKQDYNIIDFGHIVRQRQGPF